MKHDDGNDSDSPQPVNLWAISNLLHGPLFSNSQLIVAAQNTAVIKTNERAFPQLGEWNGVFCSFRKYLVRYLNSLIYRR